MRKISLAVLTIIAVALTGCVSEPEEVATEADQVAPTQSANDSWVQDLWVYDQIRTVAPDGETIDLTEHILTGLGTPSRSEPMPDGATFHIYDSLAPTVTSDGSVRADLSVIAGVIEREQVRALAALATPRADAQGSVGLDDAVELDLTFLGDLLAPGDPLVTDVIFLQARPGDGEPSLDDVALLSERMSSGRAFSYGTQTDEGLQILPLTNVLGEAVSGSTRMSVPGKGGLPYPDITGPAKGLFCPKVVFGPKEALKCLDEYFEGMVNVAEDADNLIRCNLGGCNKPGPSKEPLCIGMGCEPPTVRADPHIRSLDGQSLSMQGVGEYVLSRGESTEIQMRTFAVGSHGTASAVSMVALQIDDDRAVIGSDDGTGAMGVWINDTLVPYDTTEEYRQQSSHGAFEVIRTGLEVLIEATDGSQLYVRRSAADWLDLTVQLSDKVTGLTGLLGDNDGDPSNDWRARDGSVLAADTTGRALYTQFSDTWRVTDEESILRYLTGESTSTFTDLSYPEQIITLSDLDPEVRSQAERVCQLAGIADAVLLEQCTLDYALTGEIAFVRSAQYAERDADAYLAYLASGDQGTDDPGAGAPGSPAIDPAAWSLSPDSAGVSDAEVFVHVCPPNGSAHSVWGGDDGLYTSDSSICTASVHAGLITIERGGTVEVTRLAGLNDYGPGSTQNGITSRGWQQSWPGSFRVEG